MNRFRDTGSLHDRNCLGRPSMLTDDSLDYIRRTSLRFHEKSLRKLSLQSGLSYGRTQKTELCTVNVTAESLHRLTSDMRTRENTCILKAEGISST